MDQRFSEWVHTLRQMRPVPVPHFLHLKNRNKLDLYRANLWTHSSPPFWRSRNVCLQITGKCFRLCISWTVGRSMASFCSDRIQWAGNINYCGRPHSCAVVMPWLEEKGNDEEFGIIGHLCLRGTWDSYHVFCDVEENWFSLKKKKNPNIFLR